MYKRQVVSVQHDSKDIGDHKSKIEKQYSITVPEGFVLDESESVSTDNYIELCYYSDDKKKSIYFDQYTADSYSSYYDNERGHFKTSSDKFGNEFMINRNEDDYNEIVKLTNGIADNSELFVKLFGRLDPLAAKKRDTKAKFNLSEEIKNAIDVFSHEIAQSGIRLEFKCDSQIEYTGWKQDIYTIIVNIIDNSIFWVNESASADKKISIIVKKKENGFNVDVRDSGPGISEELLESGVIFEPEFSTKPEGTGLGLAIAGEAANRNKLILTAIQEDEGAHFILCTEE